MVGVSYGVAFALALGYLLGSIPFGLLLTRLAGAGDLRAIGSGNIGATNVLRTGRKDLAAATLVLDALKATAAVLIGAWLFGPAAALAAEPAVLVARKFRMEQHAMDNVSARVSLMPSVPTSNSITARFPPTDSAPLAI